MKFESRRIADRLAEGSGVLSLLRRRCQRGVTILMYHKILPLSLRDAYPLRNLVIDCESFRQQMAWLHEHFEVRRLSDAMRFDDGQGGKRRRPVACVTFDDGYLDNFVHAAPILDEFGLPGTFFVTSGFVEQGDLWFDRAVSAWNWNAQGALDGALKVLPHLEGRIRTIRIFDEWWGMLGHMPILERDRVLDAVDDRAKRSAEVFGPMNPGQIRDLAERGHEIGSHSDTHPLLGNLDQQSIWRELSLSREKLVRWSGQPVTALCYPNGDSNALVRSLARTAGYEFGCSLARGMAVASSDPMRLPRRGILAPSAGSLSIEGFQAELLGLRDALRTIRRRALQVAADFRSLGVRGGSRGPGKQS